MMKGIPVSRGIAIAKAMVLRTEEGHHEIKSIQASEVDREKARLKESVELAARQLTELEKQVKETAGAEQAAIMQAHMEFLSDPAFVGEMESKIAEQLITAESAVQQVAEQFIMIFESMDDTYMRERAADIRDVSKRLKQNLSGEAGGGLADIKEATIIIADDLTPSDTIQMPRQYVQGLVAAKGGATSHAAILARSLGIPAIMGIGEEGLNRFKNGDFVIIDGATGDILLNPDEEAIRQYTAAQEKEAARKQALEQLRGLNAETTDGHSVHLVANAGGKEDPAELLEKGAEGIGLFRSEFLFMHRETMPTEEEQYEGYLRAVKGMQGKPVIIRTLDIGGDKHLPYLDLPQEMNPFLGWRAIRISLSRVDLFKTQLRAILRASAHGKALIMFPMISHIEQVRQAKAILEEVKQELKSEGQAFDEAIEVGVMIEIPAAALIADDLAKEVDFFSIGTNDLVQYTIAVDRMNENISELYNYFHPAVLRLMKMVIDASHRNGIWTGMCGEMASDPLATELLVGMGLDEFSMNQNSLLEVKQRVRSISLAEAKEIAEKALSLPTVAEVQSYLASRVNEA
ncbi:phosphoenolpyruvate--protein phosphotransferase [Brevibacillus migulae]|uniref:phosphoenolpyruvate--protein phosphotransferase n=1 Tax=Brevibacillus migulae TaxID=1644114 RepID=UPI00106E7E4F|nr:phosphoenolpyruvate--protein phosphotransferase [Brevibacillus migulae]